MSDPNDPYDPARMQLLRPPSTSAGMSGWPLVSVRKGEFDALVAENVRLHALLTSYRLAVRGIPEMLLHPDWYGLRDWAANIIHLRANDHE